MKQNNFSHHFKEYGFRPSKRSGQNFLIDKNILSKIVKSSEIKPKDVILEIGAGTGILTREISKYANKINAVERDPILYHILLQSDISKNVNIINDDILNYQFDKSEKCKVIGNIPYSITTDIIFFLLRNRQHISDIFLTVQYEFAVRLVAKVGTKHYSSISCPIQYYTRPEILFEISPNCFYPKPEVKSAFIHLKVLEKTVVSPKNEQLFFSIIRNSFNQRRKMLLNSFMKIPGLEIDKEELLMLFKNTKVDLQKRPEQTDLVEFCNISDIIDSYIKKVKQ